MTATEGLCWPDPGRPLVVGHRGACAYAPENTLASFELAVTLGADMIELDLQLSRDGVPIVIHDDRLDRTTNGQGQVTQHTLAELRRLDAGSWFDSRFAGQRVPTLEEVLSWAAGKTRLAIEIKNAPSRQHGIETRLAELIDRYRMRQWVLVISFDHQALRRLREIDSLISTGVIYYCRPVDPVGVARAAGAEVLEPEWSYVEQADVAVAHAAGLRVNAWATSDPEVLQRLIVSGVDAITTNNPDLALAAVTSA